MLRLKQAVNSLCLDFISIDSNFCRNLLKGYISKWKGSMMRFAMKVWREESGRREASRGSNGNQTRAPSAPHQSQRARDNWVWGPAPPLDQTLSTHDARTVAGRQLYAC